MNGVEAGERSKNSARGHPAQPDFLVLRRERLELLKRHAEDRRLVVVQGPAGFGKTTLLRQYCDHRAALGDRIGWVRMDQNSADPSQFLRCCARLPMACTAMALRS